MKILKILLVLSLLFSPIIAQDLTPEQILELANRIKEFQANELLFKKEIDNLQLQNGLLYRQSLIDSTLIIQKNYYIEILEDNSKLLQKQSKLMSPKFYATNTAYFIYGAGLVITAIWGVNKLSQNNFRITLDNVE